MAGMFFSIQEVAAKLGKSEDEVRQIVKSGRLREFRDGPNLLFKVDEVNALLSDTSFTGVKPAPPAEKPAAPKSEEAEAEEILLAPDTPAKDEELQLTDADTQIVEEGIKVLGDTDSLAKEGSDETFKSSGSGSGTPGKEASLEEIEKDVSLDTFGSGSGLLDLSLQADDTSLGGILDEIYTPGAAGEGKAPAAAEPAAVESAAGSAMEIAAEADQMQFPEPQAPAPALAMAMTYAEPAPDAMSNALGVMLFIPLAAVIYTAMVAVAGFSNLNPAILKMSKGFIWYIVIGMAVASLLIMAIGAVMGGEKKPKMPKPPKPPKVKKEKPPKPVKEKKAK